MKIALFHNLPSGGAKRHTFEQVRELARRGHEIIEFAPTTAELDFCSLAPYVKQQRIYELKPLEPLRMRLPLVTPYVHSIQGIITLRRTEHLCQVIAREIDDDHFDLAFVKDCQLIMNPYVLPYLRTQSIFQCHHGLRHQVESLKSDKADRTLTLNRVKGLYYSPARLLFQHKFLTDQRRNVQSASRVLTNSVFSKDLLAKYYGVPSHVVYPGINTKVFQPQPIDKQNYVLSVGGLFYSKGYRFLVSALSRIDPIRRPSLFVVADRSDSDEEKRVCGMAAASGVELHIEKITDDRRLVQVYNQALVFVYAPLQEALGMAPLEALACGTPVVAVGEGGVRETVLDGVTGWLVGRDVEAFAHSLESLLSDDKARHRMGQAGIDCVRRHWTWEHAIDSLEEEFRETKNAV